MYSGLVEGGGERPAGLRAGCVREEDRRRALLLAAEPRRLQLHRRQTEPGTWETI